MFESEREIHTPTDEEEEEIQRQIAQDLDAPEWTDEDLARRDPIQLCWIRADLGFRQPSL